MRSFARVLNIVLLVAICLLAISSYIVEGFLGDWECTIRPQPQAAAPIFELDQHWGGIFSWDGAIAIGKMHQYQRHIDAAHLPEGVPIGKTFRHVGFSRPIAACVAVAAVVSSPGTVGDAIGFDAGEVRYPLWPDPNWDEAATRIRFPYWWLIVPLALPPMLWMVKAVRRVRRLDRGLCGACGYDLRGSLADRCPECGTLREVIPRPEGAVIS